jgi:hypothetical protein
VLDNLKEGVLTPDIYNPTLNPVFQRCADPLRVVAKHRMGRNIPRSNFSPARKKIWPPGTTAQPDRPATPML